MVFSCNVNSQNKTNIVSYEFVYESNNQNNINKHCKYKMAAERSKPYKTIDDWFFLGQLININETCVPVIAATGSN